MCLMETQPVMRTVSLNICEITFFTTSQTICQFSAATRMRLKKLYLSNHETHEMLNSTKRIIKICTLSSCRLLHQYLVFRLMFNVHVNIFNVKQLIEQFLNPLKGDEDRALSSGKM